MKLRFGLSLSVPEQFSALGSHLPEELSVLEFPGELLDSADRCAKLKSFRKKGVRLIGGNFITPEITALIPEENCKIRAELEEHFAHRCMQAKALDISDLALCADLGRALDSPEYAGLLANLLRRFCGILRHFGQTLHLSVRIPGAPGFDSWKALPAFRRDLMLPNLKWLPELHPHEPGAAESIPRILEHFSCNEFCRRICYNAEAGNSLTENALNCCIVSDARIPDELVLLLAPGIVPIDSASMNSIGKILARGK